MLEHIPHYEYIAGREERLLLVGWLLLSPGPQGSQTVVMAQKFFFRLVRLLSQKVCVCVNLWDCVRDTNII